MAAKKPERSRGCAFLEFSKASGLQNALRLHHSELDGRKINVELSAGGGGKNEARVKKLKEKNAKLDVCGVYPILFVFILTGSYRSTDSAVQLLTTRSLRRSRKIQGKCDIPLLLGQKPPLSTSPLGQFRKMGRLQAEEVRSTVELTNRLEAAQAAKIGKGLIAGPCLVLTRSRSGKINLNLCPTYFQYQQNVVPIGGQ